MLSFDLPDSEKHGVKAAACCQLSPGWLARSLSRFRDSLCRVLLGGALLWSAAGGYFTAHADEVHFPNGDRLSGVFLEVRDGSVRFTHPILGELLLPGEGLVVLGTSGELLFGATAPTKSAQAAQAAADSPADAADPAAAPQADGGISAGAAAAGTSPRDGVVAPLPGEWQEPPSRQRVPFDLWAWWLENRPERGGLGGFLPEPWKGRITLGLNFRRATTESEEFRVRVRAERRYERLNTSYEAFYEFGESFDPRNNSTSTFHDQYGGITDFRYDLSPRIFARVNQNYIHNEVRNIDHDWVQNYGLGWRILDSARFKLNLIPAAIIQYRDFPGSDVSWARLPSIGNEFTYIFNRSLRFEQKATLGIDPSDGDNRKYNLHFSSILSVSEWVELIAAYDREYDTFVLTNTSRDEERIRLSLAIPF